MKSRLRPALRSRSPKRVKAKPPTGAVRTGGRSARVVGDVLRVTLAEIDRVGYAALRVEEVAARSGVNKTTIYRRWPSKAELVASAVRAIKAPATIADTGDLVGDFTDSFVDSLCRVDAPELRGLIRMIQVERDQPEVNALIKELREAQAEIRSARLRVAVERGELPKDTDVELVQSVLSGAVFGPLMRIGEKLPPERVRAVVSLVLAGAGRVSVDAVAKPSKLRDRR